ncbi:heat shock protein Hsp20 [Truepera radiovictrix DSM 17093]|uniref:Heat shock protein Hsp20 n=1 Tax=Truepera radiovictrix (strain DSM 17093 / CIP 108686 / LMG 22925 / RQ-24) TaxID=649638 RepID=D7CVV5_TRURR|nr:heat shock protein Hsp20 [Truepera radiovictrix DSM 17093]
MAMVRAQDARPVPVQRWDLTEGAGSLFREFDRLFEQLASPMLNTSSWAYGYPVDLYETADNVVLEMAVPGVHVQDLDVSVEGRQLTISGTLPNVADEGRRYWLQTIPRGQFSRTVSLPASVELDNIQASVHEGLLTLTMPKAAAAKARKIEITSG